jgi:hypothetical protein
MRATDAMRALMVLVLLGFGVTAQAAEPGSIVQGSVRLADKQMPLPRGDWLLAGRGVQPLPDASTGPFGVVRTAILLQLTGDRVTAIAEFNTNDVSVSGGWEEPAGCGSATAEPHVVRYRSEFDFACIVVAETRPGSGGPPAWRDVAAYVAAHRWHLPETMLTASFSISDRQDIIDARLHFAPVGYPGGEESRQMLLAWAAGFAIEFEEGMANQLAGPPLDGPLRSALLSDAPALDRRLIELEALQRDGTISASDALMQQQAALSERPRSAEGQVIDLNSWYYRASTPLINLVTAYSVTQSGPLAIAIMLSEHVAHSLVYVANEASWDRATARAMRHKVPWPTLVHIGAIDDARGPAS